MRIEQEDQKLKPLVAQLKRGIDEIMPVALETYESSCKNVAEQKAAAIACKEADKPDQIYKNPRRKFPWTAPLR